MKKFIISILIIALGAGVGIGIGSYLTNIRKNEPVTEVPSPDKFVWGVTNSSYQVDGYSSAIGDREIKYINELGVNTVRLTLERNINSLAPLNISYDEKTNDSMIDKLNADKKDAVLIIDGDIIASSKIQNFDYETAGYQMGAYAAKRYKGKIKYYQTANELTGTIIKPADPDFKGAVIDGKYDLQYSVDRYNATLGWLKGMSRAIRQYDPDAKIVVSGHWILYDIINRLKADGLDFDVLGWAWYSTDGTDITKRDIGDGETINLATELNKIGKPVWIIESNTDKGSYGNGKVNLSQGENLQSDFFKKFTKNVLGTGLIKGFFAYTMYDDPTGNKNGNPDQTHWGIIEVKDKNGVPELRKKKAYYAYRDAILSAK